MFEHRIVGLGYELLSVLLLPFFLYTSGAGCAGEIVDFFREFTVKVEGVGYMCSFAVFDFERHGDNRVSFL
jgi:autophagy-related protein 9